MLAHFLGLCFADGEVLLANARKWRHTSRTVEGKNRKGNEKKPNQFSVCIFHFTSSCSIIDILPRAFQGARIALRPTRKESKKKNQTKNEACMIKAA